MRQYRDIFQDPKFILEFVLTCDRAVLTCRWRTDSTIFNPEHLIDNIRQGLPNFGSPVDQFNHDEFFDNVCDLVEMVVGASACGAIDDLTPLQVIKDQITQRVGNKPIHMFDQPYTTSIVRTLIILNKDVAGCLDGIEDITRSLLA